MLNPFPLASNQAALLCPLPFPPFTPYLPADPNCTQPGQDGAVAQGQAVLTYSLEQACFVLQQNCSWKDKNVGSETKGSLSTLTRVEPGLGQLENELCHLPVTEQ